MSVLNESGILKKLETLHSTQESIETLSLWCLHHKDSHFLIVETWSKCFKTGEKTPPSKPPINKEKILTDFKLSKLLVDLESESSEVQQLKKSEAILPKTPFSTQNSQQHLKDKQNGLKIQSEIDQAYQNLENYVQNLEKVILNRRKLILNLEQAEIFYETQYEEAKVVQNAYKKFGQGVELVHRELTKILSPDSQTTASSSAAAKSATPRPDDDAPSPSPNDDPFALGVEAVVAACKSSNSDPIDMDIEDDGLKVSTNKSFMTSPTDFHPFLTQGVKTSPSIAHWPAPPPPPAGASFFARTPLPRAPPPFPPMRFLQPPPMAPPTAAAASASPSIANGKKDSDMRILAAASRMPLPPPRADFRVTPTRFQRFV